MSRKKKECKRCLRKVLWNYYRFIVTREQSDLYLNKTLWFTLKYALLSMDISSDVSGIHQQLSRLPKEFRLYSWYQNLMNNYNYSLSSMNEEDRYSLVLEIPTMFTVLLPKHTGNLMCHIYLNRY